MRLRLSIFLAKSHLYFLPVQLSVQILLPIFLLDFVVFIDL